MSLERRRFGVISLSGSIAFFLAIAPILDPYIVAEIGSGITIRVNDIFIIFFGLLCFSRNSHINRRTYILCVWVAGFALISIMGNIISTTPFSSSLKNAAIWMIYAILLMYVWGYDGQDDCRSKFLYYVEIIALIGCLLAIVQFVCGHLGIGMWNGKIPFLQLSKYDGWAGYIDKNTGDIRPNGIFQEPSYLGIFTSVALTNALKRQKYIRVFIYALTMLLTTSLVAIVLGVFIICYLVLKSKDNQITPKLKRRIVLFVVLALVVSYFYAQSNQAIINSINYIYNRLLNFQSDLTGARMGSTKYRIMGHIDLFSRYSISQKIFGLGIGQYSAYFGVSSYSNVWVTTLLNSGVVGVIWLIICIISLFRRIKKEQYIFVFIFLIVISVDYQWFGWYFFYLITSAMLKTNE